MHPDPTVCRVGRDFFRSKAQPGRNPWIHVEHRRRAADRVFHAVQHIDHSRHFLDCRADLRPQLVQQGLVVRELGSQQPNAAPVEMTFPVVTQGQYTEPAQYENIILRASQNGSAIVRLGDVARAEIGLKQYIVDTRLNGTPATLIAVYQQPGSNGLVVSKAVRETMAALQAKFPKATWTVYEPLA